MVIFHSYVSLPEGIFVWFCLRFANQLHKMQPPQMKTFTTSPGCADFLRTPVWRRLRWLQRRNRVRPSNDFRCVKWFNIWGWVKRISQFISKDVEVLAILYHLCKFQPSNFGISKFWHIPIYPLVPQKLKAFSPNGFCWAQAKTWGLVPPESTLE